MNGLKINFAQNVWQLLLAEQHAIKCCKKIVQDREYMMTKNYTLLPRTTHLQECIMTLHAPSIDHLQGSSHFSNAPMKN